MRGLPDMQQDTSTAAVWENAFVDAVGPLRRGDIVAHELDGEGIMYDPRSADTHRLNASAWFIWNCCDGRHAPSDIAARLADSFDVNPAQALHHVHAAIDQFHKVLLITEPRVVPLDTQGQGSARAINRHPAAPSTLRSGSPRPESASA